MLRRVDDLRGFTIAATDEEIGSVDDFYFDDKTWSIRYLIVDTGPWLVGKQVLISPTAVEAPVWEAKILPVNLTKEQVENSPGIGVDQPVSRQHEIDLHNHYGWPGYWYAAPGMAAPMSGVYPAAIPPAAVATPVDEQADPGEGKEEAQSDPHLRSVQEVLGYNIHATDGSIGHVEDFFASESDWRIRYVLIDTRNWLPGRKVLVGTDWIDRIDWTERGLFVKVTQEQVRNSPEFDPKDPLTRRYEEDLYGHYHFQGYWF